MTTCRFKLEKETKGAYQYKQTHENDEPVGRDNDDKMIGTIYFRKARWDGRDTVEIDVRDNTEYFQGETK